MLSLPESYGPAFERLDSFANEAADWDGYGGIPASESVVADVTAFLHSCIQQELPRPSLTLSNSGAVSAIWKKVNDVFVSVLFAGRGFHSYSVIVGGKPACSAQVDSAEIDSELTKRIRDLNLPVNLGGSVKPYASAFKRLRFFSELQNNWNGQGGRPASIEVLNGSAGFLNTALWENLPEPALELRGSGAVTATWEDDQGWYIQVEITDNVRYTYAISRSPALPSAGVPARGGLLLTGVSQSLSVEPALIEHVRQVRLPQ